MHGSTRFKKISELTTDEKSEYAFMNAVRSAQCEGGVGGRPEEDSRTDCR